jgi:hypothetical protein
VHSAVRKFVVYLIAAWSGYFVMALELLGGRALGPYFGSGIYVWGAVITLFMLSLSLGYLLGGYLSVSGPSPRHLATILLAATLAGAPVTFASTSILEAVYGLIADPRYGALLAAVALFFLPATIAGAVSPYAIRLLIDHPGTAGRVAGKIFFISTLGSTLGTLLTSFYLVLLFDLDDILRGMVAISLVIVAIAFVLQRNGHRAAA